ncbi:MAG: hypothetical protein N3G18_10565 [Candidatus Saccharicenans sp.]|nr:hypothetical protein [Candidatus Saccharicenans sp.]
MKRTYGKGKNPIPALVLFLVLLSSAPVIFSQDNQPGEKLQAKLLPGMEILLPENSPVKVNWILPPVDRAALEIHLHDRWFSVDAEGFPWIGLDGRLLINPIKNYSAFLPEFFTNFTHLNNGALVIATDEDFGFIPAGQEIDYDPDTGYPVLGYQPLARLPGKVGQAEDEMVSQAMYRGENCLYFLVRKTFPGEDYREKNEVFCFKPGAGQKADGISQDSGSVFPSFVSIYTSDEPITAVAGDGDKTFIAHGQMVLLVSSGSSEPEVFYVHPVDTIQALDYSQEAGLFYATDYSVGLMSKGAALEFLKVPSPRIFLRDNSLYVMLSEQAAVIQVENAGFLKQYNKTSRVVVGVDGVKVSGGWFRFNFLLFLLAVFILLIVVLVDVLRHRFPGHVKTVWVLMVFLSYLSLLSWLAVFFYFGLALRLSWFLLLIPFLVILVYLLSGRKQKIKG